MWLRICESNLVVVVVVVVVNRSRLYIDFRSCQNKIYEGLLLSLVLFLSEFLRFFVIVVVVVVITSSHSLTLLLSFDYPIHDLPEIFFHFLKSTPL